MLTQLWTVLIVAWTAVVNPDVAAVPPAPNPAFSAVVLQPNLDAEKNQFACFVCGNFQDVPTQLQLKIFLRLSDPAKPKNAIVSPAFVCVQTSTIIAPACTT